jgi:hypothetical protein
LLHDSHCHSIGGEIFSLPKNNPQRFLLDSPPFVFPRLAQIHGKYLRGLEDYDFGSRSAFAAARRAIKENFERQTR